MKRITSLLMVSSIFFMSCSKDEEVLTKTHLNLDSKEINVDAAKTKKTIKVDTNTDFTVKSDAKWIKILKQEKTKIEIEIYTNILNQDRTGNVSVTSVDKKIKKVVKVYQKALVKVAVEPENTYISVADDFSFNENNIRAFENKRKNSEVLPDSNMSILKYKVEDTLFNAIWYQFKVGNYKKALLYIKDGLISETDRKNYEKFLLKKGYEKITEKGFETTLAFSKVDKMKFINNKNGTKIEFMGDPKANHYLVTYYPVQSGLLTTLSSFPDFTKWDSKKNIEDFEAKNNGILDEGNSKFDYIFKGDTKDRLFYKVSDGADNIVAREYYVTKTGSNIGASQKSLYFKNRSLAFYTGKDTESYLTSEFKQLLQDNGYTFYKITSKKSHIYKKGSSYVSVAYVEHSAFTTKVIKMNLY